MNYANALEGLRHAFLTRRDAAAILVYKDTRSIARLISNGKLKSINFDTGAVCIYDKEVEKFFSREGK